MKLKGYIPGQGEGGRVYEYKKCGHREEFPAV